MQQFSPIFYHILCDKSSMEEGRMRKIAVQSVRRQSIEKVYFLKIEQTLYPFVSALWRIFLMRSGRSLSGILACLPQVKKGAQKRSF